MITRSGAVRVDHHQFSIGDPVADTLAGDHQGTLLQAGPGFVTVLAGVAYGPVRVTVQLLDDAPPGDSAIDDWEVVEETALESATAVRVLTLDGEIAAVFDPIPAGRYRLRGHGRGRDQSFDLEVTDPIEDYLLQLWSAPIMDPGVRQLRKTDRAFSAVESRVPQVSLDHVHIFDSDGRVVRVPAYSPEAEAVRARNQEWGGRPPSPALAGNLRARIVAALDRELLDRIEAATADEQRAFARWCVHRAFERAGIAGLDWIQEALVALDANQPAPPDFANGSLAQYRLEEDRRIPLTVVTGIPGTVDLIQQKEGLRTYFAATELPPLDAAMESVRSAAQTYGMEYGQLTAAAKRDFFDKQSNRS